MMIQLTCAWCQEEIDFAVDETRDELVCTGCNTRTEFAPDPATTYGLLYELLAA